MKKEVKIALVAITALVVLFFGLNFLKGLTIFSNNAHYYLTFKNVDGVGKNTPVYADGVRLGTVESIIYDYSHEKPTVVNISVSKDMRIPKGSTAVINGDLMGNTDIELLLSNNMRERLNPGDTIVGSEEEGAIEKLKALMPVVENIAPKLDSILYNLNELLKSPALRATLDNAEKITDNLTVASKHLNSIMANVNNDLPALMKKADGVLGNAETLTGNLAQLDLQSTLNKVDNTLAGVQKTFDKLNSTEGTIGKLINDPSLFDNLNATMVHADSLVIDLKAHPKRYVHFSVFGRKN